MNPAIGHGGTRYDTGTRHWRGWAFYPLCTQGHLLLLWTSFADAPVWAVWQAMLGLYLLLALATLGVNFKTRTSPASQLRQQVHAWWMIFPFVSLSLLLHPAGPALLALFIAVLAWRELAWHHRAARWRLALACSLVLGMAMWQAHGQSLLAAGLLAALVLAQLAHFWWHRRPDALLVLLFLLLCCGLLFMLQLDHLRLSPERRLGWLFYLFALTALNDIAQFISGKCFGRQKIAPHISPNKTWQGLAGGMLVSVLASTLLGWHLRLAAWPFLVLLGLLLSLGGFLGDLLFSAAKRFLGIKDFSQLIPGHGGILDRVDSLVLTAPLLHAALSAWPPGS